MSDKEITDVVAKIEAIVGNKNPFGQIQKLPELIKKFIDKYVALLEKEAAQMAPIVDNDYKKVMAALDSKPFVDVFRTKFANAFAELKKKLETSNEISAVKNIRLESDTLKLRCLDEINEYERNHQPVPVTPPTTGETDSVNTPVEPTAQTKKKRKNLSISNVAGARTYFIENEQDIDNFLADMKKNLMSELETDTIITLS